MIAFATYEVQIRTPDITDTFIVEGLSAEGAEEYAVEQFANEWGDPASFPEFVATVTVADAAEEEA